MKSCVGRDATGASKGVVVSHRETEKVREREQEREREVKRSEMQKKRKERREPAPR